MATIPPSVWCLPLSAYQRFRPRRLHRLPRVRCRLEVDGALATEQPCVSELEATPTPIRRGPFGLQPTVIDHRGRVWKLARTPLRESFTWKDAWSNRPKLRGTLQFLVVAILAWGLLQGVAWSIRFAGLPPLKNTRSDVLAFVELIVATSGILAHIVWVFGIAVSAAWLGAPHSAAAMLRKCICPHCRFSLSGISPDTEGCAVCPECGAAWKLPPPPPNNPV